MGYVNYGHLGKYVWGNIATSEKVVVEMGTLVKLHVPE